MSDGYDLSDGLWHLFVATRNGGAKGTNVYALLSLTRNLLGHNVPPAFIDYIMKVQSSQFGSFPDSNDVAPCAIFFILFFILGSLHFTIYCINTSRGHYFPLSLGWIGYCLLRCIGWICRLVWAKDITKIDTGIASEIFMIIPTIVLVSINLILAQRIFSWRHPVGGSRKLFWNIMNTMYGLVLVIIAITVFVAVFPFYHFLSPQVYNNLRSVNKASSILIVVYSVTSLNLLGLAYFFKPAKDDKELYSYQPWWLESFSPFYFVEKGAAKAASESFLRRNHYHRHAFRVIASTHGYYQVVKGLSNKRGDLKHNKSIAIIVTSTIIIFIGSICRAVAVFQDNRVEQGGVIYEPWIMYTVWGILEVFINLLYIVGRVDLRFYKPDRLPSNVREIITEEQSVKDEDEELEINDLDYNEIQFKTFSSHESSEFNF